MNQSLKDLRKPTSLTVTAVARLMGVSQPRVSELESGHHVPRADTLARYYTAIGRDDLAAPLLPMLNNEQRKQVDEIQQRLDAFVAELPPFYRSCIRSTVGARV